MEMATTREDATALALIAAGGEGKRLGALGPKALVVCAGRTLLDWCLSAFAESHEFTKGAGRVVVAAHDSDMPAFEAECESARARGVDVRVTAGGPSRSHSVAAALRAGLAGGEATDVVLVHDAARIFTSAELIDRLCGALRGLPETTDGLVAAMPATDTVKLVDDELTVIDTPPRDRVWMVQTPQAFRVASLSAALGLDAPVEEDLLAAATDDASLIEARGGAIKLLEWRLPNQKITTPADLAQAEAVLRERG